MISSSKPGLTERQTQILEFLQQTVRENGYAPTLREIGEHFGIRSTNGVNDHIRALEKKGYVTREGAKSRTLRLLGSTTSRELPARANDDIDCLENLESTVEIPILGRVAAGALSEAISQAEDTVRIDRMLLRRHQEVFGLRIVGDSMIEAGIFDGDYVFVRKQLEPKQGNIVIALVGDEATCKYFYPEASQIRLVPANARMQPILIPRNMWSSTQILGVVVGVYRKFE